ncbi:MAG: alpha/beta hydrolase [Chitinophagaceae bacterium]
MKKIFLFLLSAQCVAMSYAQEIIPLYDKKIPGAISIANREKSEIGKDGILRISKVSEPTLLYFPAPKDKANGTAVIICPGGGYAILAASHEGTDVAKVFNEWGVTAFVLKYRLPDDSTMEHKENGPLQDAQRAFQLVRNNAKKYGVEKNKIGIMGFSAGGHLASTAGTHFNHPVSKDLEHTNLRPDFMILLYPVISLTDSLAHMGSRTNLIGKTPTQEKINYYSNELQVTKETPPTFLVHAKDDGGVKVQNSIAFYDALQKNGVPSEIHLFEKGGHGFGMNNKTTDEKWMDWLKVWMQKNGWVK